jgi:hypothetical protein
VSANWFNHSLLEHRLVDTIAAIKVYIWVNSILVSKCIFDLTQLCPYGFILVFTLSLPLGASSSLHNPSLHVNLCTVSITLSDIHISLCFSIISLFIESPHPCVLLSSLNCCLQVQSLGLHYSTICSLIHRVYIHLYSKIDNSEYIII